MVARIRGRREEFLARAEAEYVPAMGAWNMVHPIRCEADGLRELLEPWSR